MNKEIKLHTIATFQGKECELEELLNILLKKINEKDKRIDKAIEFMDTLCDEYADDDYDIKCKVFDKLYQVLKGDNE